MVGKAIGIGGVFFRSRDTAALAAWYETHLGVPGFWQQQAGLTVFAPFKADTDYFPADRQWMINFRVDDLDALITSLKTAGIAVETRVGQRAERRRGNAAGTEGEAEEDAGDHAHPAGQQFLREHHDRREGRRDRTSR
jgi:hypothetical protein